MFVGGGIIAGIVLVAFGIASIVMGTNGRSTVNDQLSQEQIVGTPDMTPTAIAAEAKKAGLKNVSLPTCSVANKTVDSGSSAKCFADYMRIHALEATGGQTYSQMDRYLAPGGGTTSDEAKAKVDKSGQPVENPARQTWVTETALGTALNVSYFAGRVSEFAIVMGVALLLTGIGMLVLTLGALRRREPAAQAKAATTGRVAHAGTA
jgi:uncharacterized membrane protein YidH (DUF202 family)